MNPRSSSAIRGWQHRKRRPPRYCTYRGCQAQHKAYGLCLRHYAQMRAGRIRVDALDDAARSATLIGYPSQCLDRGCDVCGCPTVFGLCPMCCLQMSGLDLLIGG